MDWRYRHGSHCPLLLGNFHRRFHATSSTQHRHHYIFSYVIILVRLYGEATITLRHRPESSTANINPLVRMDPVVVDGTYFNINPWMVHPYPVHYIAKTMTPTHTLLTTKLSNSTC